MARWWATWAHTILRDRQALATRRLCDRPRVVDRRRHTLTAEPEIISQGFVYVPESAALMTAARDAINGIVSHNGHGVDPEEEIGREIKRGLSDLFYRETRRRPVVIAMVTAVDRN